MGSVPVPTISAADVRLAQQRGDSFVLLDVREGWEWEQGHVAQARHLPMNDVPHRLAELDPTHKIVVMCHRGQRSATVAQYLRGQGYGDVWNMEGGIDRWIGQGYPVE